MVKVKRFETSIFCLNPAKAMEKFISEHSISKDKIINIASTDVNIRGITKPAYTLTYDDGK